MSSDDHARVGDRNTGVALGANINQQITIYNLNTLPNLPPTELRSQIGDKRLVGELVQMLARNNSFCHNVHRPLESGFHVTDYIDLRILAMDGLIANAFGRAVVTLIDPPAFDMLVGLDPIALAVSASASNLTDKPCSYFLSFSTKPRVIENKVPKAFGTRLILLSDVVATTETIRVAVKSLQSRGFSIRGVVAIVVRGGLPSPQLPDLNIEFRWVLAYPFQNHPPNKCPACVEGKVFM